MKWLLNGKLFLATQGTEKQSAFEKQMNLNFELMDFSMDIRGLSQMFVDYFSNSHLSEYLNDFYIIYSKQIRIEIHQHYYFDISSYVVKPRFNRDRGSGDRCTGKSCPL